MIVFVTIRMHFYPRCPGRLPMLAVEQGSLWAQVADVYAVRVVVMQPGAASGL
jgi:hypothetical protein